MIGSRGLSIQGVLPSPARGFVPPQVPWETYFLGRTLYTALQSLGVEEIAGRASWRSDLALLERQIADNPLREGRRDLVRAQLREWLGYSRFHPLENRIHTELERCLDENRRVVFGAIAGIFTGAWEPVQTLDLVQTQGAFAHEVYRVGLGYPHAERDLYFKRANTDVEQFGAGFSELAGLPGYRIEQFGPWGVSEEVPGRKLHEIDMDEAQIRVTARCHGQYLAAFWTFGIIERDKDGNNFLVDKDGSARFIDMEVVLAPEFARIPDLACDLAHITKFIRDLHSRELYVRSLQDGFLTGCRAIRSHRDRGMELILGAEHGGLKVGFSGHEAGVYPLGFGRVLVKPGWYGEIRQRLRALCEGDDSDWNGILTRILAEYRSQTAIGGPMAPRQQFLGE